MMSNATFRDFLDWGADAQGSTRAVGLLRILLAIIAITRFGAELAPFAADTLGGLLLGLVFFVFATASLLGIRSRVSIGMLGVLIMVLYALTQTGIGLAGWNHHHVYILGISCIFLSMTDCGRSYSWDRWQALHDHPGAVPEHGQLWGQRLISLQMSALYYWAAVDKTNMAFLSGERLHQIFVWSYSGRFLEILLLSPALLAVLSIAVTVLEYYLAAAILMNRYRTATFAMGLGLHAGFYLLLPVNTYSITMMVLYLALLRPDAVHKATVRIQGA